MGFFGKMIDVERRSFFRVSKMAGLFSKLGDLMVSSRIFRNCPNLLNEPAFFETLF